MLTINPKEIDLLNAEHIKALIEEIEGTENINRKKEAWKAFQVLDGNQSHFVKKELQRIYPQTHAKFRIGDVSLSKKVVRKKSKAYKQSPKRELDNDRETEAYSEITNAGQLNRVMKESDQIFNYHKYLAVWTSYINPTDLEDGFYNFQALSPYDYDLIRDDITGEPLLFSIGYADNNITGLVGTNDAVKQTIVNDIADRSSNLRKYSIWNPRQHVQVIVRTKSDKKKEILNVQLPGNESNINPIGRIPVSFISMDLSPQYPVASNLHNQSINWNVSFSDLKTAASVQGHGQLVIKHPDGANIKSLHMGLHTSISLPQSKKEGTPPTTAEYINPSPDLAGQLEVLKFDAINILDEHGIHSKGGIEGGIEEFSSGFDRLLSMADVNELIEENQNIYSVLESDIYDVVKATESALNKNTFRSEKLKISFPKPKPMISEKEIAEIVKEKESLGVIEEWEKLIAFDPNLSEEDAKAKLARIKAESQARMENVQSIFQPKPVIEEESEEEDEEEAI